MKFIFFLGMQLLAFFSFANGEESEKRFVVVIPSYNNASWVEQNLNSVFCQKYPHFRVVYVDDASTDGTKDLVNQYVERNRLEDCFILLANKEKNGALACLCRGINECDKNEIIVDLDGNDWLSHDEALAELNHIYADPNVWMTYGQFVFYPDFSRGFASSMPKSIAEENKFRSFGGAVTHLKTFYASLFQEIKREDFLYEGKFISRAYDLAYSIPISEMAGEHIKFISDVLYVYNRTQPINDHKASDAVEEEMDRFIRSKEKYAPLEELPYSEAPHLVSSDSIYSQVKDLFHPTIKDYQLVQDFLTYGNREHLDRLGDMQNGQKKTKIIGTTPDEFPKSGNVHVNCSDEDRENCLIIYSTFNRNFPKGLKRLLKLVVESDFKGHVLYQLGGWPDTEGGSLVLAHVPYAFKVSFFKEAQRLGYKRVLWLDTSVIPLVSLNEIFKMIEEKGVFVMGNSHMLGPYMNPQSAAYFGLTHQDTYNIPSCSAGLFGVDFSQKLGRDIIDRLYRAAHDKEAFFSARSDQCALSTILYQLNVSDFVPLERMPHSKNEIRPDSLFWLDREFVH